MLSLKERRPTLRRQSRPGKTILDLPSEVLDIVIRYLYSGSEYYLSAVLPSSLSCHHLRRSSNPILFGHITVIADGQGLHRRSYDILQHLLKQPVLLRHVRTLCVCNPLEYTAQSHTGDQRQTIKSADLIGKCLKLMTGLRNLKIENLSKFTINVLECVKDRTEMHVFLKFLRLQKRDVYACDAELYAPFVAQFRDLMAVSNSHRINLSLPDPMMSHHQLIQICEVLNPKTMHALNFPGLRQLFQLVSQSNMSFETLQELRVSDSTWLAIHPEIPANLRIDPWTDEHFLAPLINLKRLHLEGHVSVSTMLPAIADHLVCLESLRLQPNRTVTLHRHCANRPGLSSQTEGLAYTRIGTLRHLELLHVCSHLSLQQITTPHLQSLSLILPELRSEHPSTNPWRSPQEIRWLGQHVPDLERLELHVGDLKNLWHPIAILGVDVDVEVYPFLEALSKMRKLKRLRLFPRYIIRGADDTLHNAAQPISDEQAVRIFRYFKRQGSPLQLLSIGATFGALRAFSPMSWTIRDAGSGKLILNTRQAGKDYELEQVWVGEKRLTMRTIRHTHPKPYMPNLGDWAFSI